MAGKGQCSPTDWLKGNVIGSGSFGTIHLAIDTTTGSFFVVKSARSKAGIVPLKNEAKLLENLDSPHIIKCMGKDISNEKCSLFFEYMGGGSLADVVQKFGGSLNEKLTRLYTRGILLGLKYLHRQGIVHCDIKCRNILLGTSGAVKLADFGCAKRLIDDDERRLLRSWKGIGGTPLWMAPEVVRNEGLDFSADIWSLGCTIIEMATGGPAWRGDASSPMAMLLRIATGDEVPEFPGHFSPEGRDFLSKCLERHPRKRWTSEELLGHPFVAQATRVRKEDMLSPTSVFDVASYEDDSDDEIESRIPRFSMKCCLEDKKVASENILFLEASSDSWITVRSRL
ncbi:hypothetical protein ACS0TY_011567 [Phlomoides rotata]